MVLDTATQSHHLTKSISGILAAADAGEPGIEKLLLAALQGLKVPNLEELIAAGNLNQAMAAVAATKIPPADLDAIADLISAISLTVAKPEAAALKVAFNEVNERTIRWAKQNVARNIVGVTPANLTIIRDTITQSLEAGVGPRVTARHIQDLIGLTPGHEKAVNRLYFRSLADGIDVDHARRIAERKAKRLLRWRAQMIARSESITAANMGQQLTWETALDEGLLPQGTRKIWMATGDNRTCFQTGTPVNTPGGTRPIETLQPGDLVETPQGYRPVKATAMTRYGGDMIAVLDSRGQIAASTADHEWWSDGWVEAQALRVGDSLQTAGYQSVNIVGVAKFSLRDTNNGPSVLRELGVPDSILRRVMPVVAVDFQSDAATDSEVHDPTPDLVFLNVSETEPIQRFADGAFDRRFALEPAVAAHRAKLPVLVAGEGAELDAALGASQESGGPSAHLRTMATVGAFGLEPFTARGTVTVHGVDCSAFDGANLIAMGDTLLDGETLFTSGTDFRDFPRRGSQVAATVAEPAIPHIVATGRPELYPAFFTDEHVGINPLRQPVAFGGTENADSVAALWANERFSATVTGVAEAFLQSRIAGSHLVYDLSIDGPPMYYANGVLVHNCPICAVLDGTVIEIVSSFAVNRQATKFVRTGSTFRVAATKPMKNPSTVKTPKAHFMCRCAMRLERL